MGSFFSIKCKFHSSEQMKEHYLTPAFEIKDAAGGVTFKAYYTNRDLSCSLNKKN